jgi:hypothetical protein
VFAGESRGRRAKQLVVSAKGDHATAEMHLLAAGMRFRDGHRFVVEDELRLVAVIINEPPLRRAVTEDVQTDVLDCDH